MAAHHPMQDDWPPPVEIVNPAGSSHFVLTAEHASRHMPVEYHGLGLTERDLGRHIAWDIGVAPITRSLAASLDAPAFLGTYSRLLIDLNRPIGVPSSIPLRSEATDIPGNIDLSDDDRQRRADRMFTPFHQTVARHLDERRGAGRRTLIAAIHSFTPVFHGVVRPWHAGVLFSHSKAYAEALLAELGRDGALVVAGNEPYTVDRASDYTIPIHGEDRGIPAVLIEIRQDLIGDEVGQREWADRLHSALSAIDPELASG